MIMRRSVSYAGRRILRTERKKGSPVSHLAGGDHYRERGAGLKKKLADVRWEENSDGLHQVERGPNSPEKRKRNRTKRSKKSLRSGIKEGGRFSLQKNNTGHSR